MKLLLLLLFPIAGLGQSDTAKYKFPLDAMRVISTADSNLLFWHGGSGTVTSYPPNPVIDTARVMIFYADTTSTIMFSQKLYGQLCGWQFGYEVFEKRLRQYYSVIHNGIFVDKPGYDLIHIAYLDSRMKPLSKSIVVIQTIKL